MNGNWTYGYDGFNRLVSSNKNSGALSFTYDYDRYGNRWHQNVTAGSGPAPQYAFSASATSGSFSNRNQIVPSPPLPNTCTSANAYCYDAAGNLMNDGLSRAFIYDAENRIVSVNSGASAYVYDAQGDRVRKTVSGVSVDYLYDLSGHIVNELSSTGTWNRGEVFAGGKHLATYIASTTYFVHADWLGTERARSKMTGQLCESVASLPFGDGQTITYSNGCTADTSPLHFAGKQRDPETNLDDFGARYFSSTAGRWMSPDWAANAVAVPYANFGKPQSLNLYAYVGNDPIDGEDPDGHGVQGALEPAGNGIGPDGSPLPEPFICFWCAQVAGDFVERGWSAVEDYAVGAAGALADMTLISDHDVNLPASNVPDNPAGQAGGLTTTIGLGLIGGEEGAAEHLTEKAGSARFPQDLGVAAKPPAPLSLDRPVGPSPMQNAVAQADVKAAQGQGASDIRINQHQVNAAGQRVGINRPDLQYTNPAGKRVYTEYGSAASTRELAHQQRIKANDPNGIVKLKKVD